MENFYGNLRPMPDVDHISRPSYEGLPYPQNDYSNPKTEELFKRHVRLEGNKEYQDIFQDECWLFLLKADSDFLERARYSGERSDSGYLMKTNGEESNSLPSMLITAGLDRVIAVAYERYRNEVIKDEEPSWTELQREVKEDVKELVEEDVENQIAEAENIEAVDDIDEEEVDEAQNNLTHLLQMADWILRRFHNVLYERENYRLTPLFSEYDDHGKYFDAINREGVLANPPTNENDYSRTEMMKGLAEAVEFFHHFLNAFDVERIFAYARGDLQSRDDEYSLRNVLQIIEQVDVFAREIREFGFDTQDILGRLEEIHYAVSALIQNNSTW